MPGRSGAEADSFKIVALRDGKREKYGVEVWTRCTGKNSNTLASEKVHSRCLKIVSISFTLDFFANFAKCSKIDFNKSRTSYSDTFRSLTSRSAAAQISRIPAEISLSLHLDEHSGRFDHYILQIKMDIHMDSQMDILHEAFHCDLAASSAVATNWWQLQ